MFKKAHRPTAYLASYAQCWSMGFEDSQDLGLCIVAQTSFSVCFKT